MVSNNYINGIALVCNEEGSYPRMVYEIYIRVHVEYIIQYKHNEELTTADSWNKTLYMYFYDFLFNNRTFFILISGEFIQTKPLKKSIPFLILFHFSICMYTIIAYDRMVSSPIYIFFRLLFLHPVIKSHIAKGQHKQGLLSSLDIYSQ